MEWKGGGERVLHPESLTIFIPFPKITQPFSKQPPLSELIRGSGLQESEGPIDTAAGQRHRWQQRDALLPSTGCLKFCRPDMVALL